MNAITESMAARVTAFSRELRGNTRLRWMLVAAVLVFLVYLLLLASDFRQANQREYQLLHRQLVRLQAMDASSAVVDYSARLAEEQETSKQIESRLWQATTEGLAGADFQAWLQGQAKQHGFEKVRMELSDLRPLEGMRVPLWKLEAELTATAKNDAVVKFLEALAGNESMVIVEEFGFTPGRSNRVSALIVAYFRLGSDEEQLP
jgi:hypothetical protein